MNKTSLVYGVALARALLLNISPVFAQPVVQVPAAPSIAPLTGDLILVDETQGTFRVTGSNEVLIAPSGVDITVLENRPVQVLHDASGRVTTVTEVETGAIEVRPAIPPQPDIVIEEHPTQPDVVIEERRMRPGSVIIEEHEDLEAFDDDDEDDDDD